MKDTDLTRTLADLARALRSLDGRFMLIGGLAVVLRGFPRHTDDIDITVLGAATSPRQLAGLLEAKDFEPRIDDAVGFAEQNQVLLYRHVETGIDVDVSLAWLPFEEDAINAAQVMNVDGLELPVARIEDLLVYKAVAWRERDRRDIRELVRRYRGELELERVRGLVAEFTEAIEETERFMEFERLLEESLR